MNLYPDEAPTSNDLAETMGCSRQNVKQILYDGISDKEIRAVYKIISRMEENLKKIS